MSVNYAPVKKEDEEKPKGLRPGTLRIAIGIGLTVVAVVCAIMANTLDSIPYNLAVSNQESTRAAISAADREATARMDELSNRYMTLDTKRLDDDRKAISALVSKAFSWHDKASLDAVMNELRSSGSMDSYETLPMLLTYVAKSDELAKGVSVAATPEEPGFVDATVTSDGHVDYSYACHVKITVNGTRSYDTILTCHSADDGSLFSVGLYDMDGSLVLV